MRGWDSVARNALPVDFTSFSELYAPGTMRQLNRHIFIVSLLVTNLTTEAVQLGSIKGSAVFGRPLDLTVQVRLDAPFDETANCFSADLFQADSKFDAGRVRLDIQPAANGLDAAVRVRSVSPVNEPWAKVILRNNCGAKISRQYDFLTDFAEAPASTAQADNLLTLSALPMPPSSTAISSASLPNIKAQSTATTVRSKQVENSAKPSLKKSSTDEAGASQKFKRTMQATSEMGKSVAATAASTGQSRLKMETFELTDEHQVLLKLSSALVAPTGMRTPEEIQALAQATAVWRAINGMPAEVQPAATVVTAETQVKAPVSETAMTKQPTFTTNKLPKLTGVSEFSNLLVFGLIGLLTLALACIAWLWLRVRKASRAGYGWLNESATNNAVVMHEPTQFLPTNFNLTANDGQQISEPSFEDEIEVDITEDENVDTRPLQNNASSTRSEIASSTIKTADNKTISPLPTHFDDPRFDERVLRSKKNPYADMHNKPITSSAELLDLVLADTPPKLRSVSTPATAEQVSKPSFSATSNPTPVKDDPKGNLIDFEIFAKPIPAEKPSRFAH